MGQAAGRDQRHPRVGVPGLNRLHHRLAEVVAAADGRLVGRIEGIEHHRHARHRIVVHQLAVDEAESVGRLVTRQPLHRRHIEAVGDGALDDVAAEFRHGLVGRSARGDVARYGDGDAGGQRGHPLGGVFAVDDGVAPEDAEGRDQVFAEDLHLVVTDDDGHVRPGLGQHPGHGVDGAAAFGMAPAPDVDCDLLGQALAPAGLDQLVEAPGPALIVMHAAQVVRHAKIPPLRRGREHRAVRRAHSDDDPGHC